MKANLLSKPVSSAPNVSNVSIHPTAIVSTKAELGAGVQIGAYAVIGDQVVLGDDCIVHHHSSILGPTRLGPKNIFHPFSSIGNRTQDLKYKEEPTFLEIGECNEFREGVTVNRATGVHETTTIGSHNHFLAYAHVAHNCKVGNHCIFSNNATLAGHVLVEDYVMIGGLAAVHQFCRIGSHAMIGGCSKIVQDVPPYFMADGNPSAIRTINMVGLQRRGFSEQQLRILKQAHRIVYDAHLNTTQAIEHLERKFGEVTEIRHLIDFIRKSERGIIR